LFVIMLLGAEQVSGSSRGLFDQARNMRWQRPLAIGLGIVLLLQVGYLMVFRQQVLPEAPPLGAAFSDPAALSEILFSSYLLPFEVTSVLLLVAMIGAITLSRRLPKAERRRMLTTARNEPQPVDAKPDALENTPASSQAAVKE
jgi:NADH-quinone oxidoreductase subunit J